jgi:hypothetical protein
LEQHLAENPSLKALLPEYLTRAYQLAVIGAEKETGLSTLPSDCPYRLEEIFDSVFLPED